MKTINEIIAKTNSPISQLVNKTNISKELEKILISALDLNLAKHCQFANYQNSELTITVNNAAWATRLRYAIPEIIKQLKVQPEFKDIKRIRYTVSKNNPVPVKHKNKIAGLSKANESLLRQTISELREKINLKDK